MNPRLTQNRVLGKPAVMREEYLTRMKGIQEDIKQWIVILRHQVNRTKYRKRLNQMHRTLNRTGRI